MVNKMKKHLQAGNTLTIVMLCLIVVTILTFSAMYSISYTTSYRLKKSSENFETIMLENQCYEVLNSFIESYDKNNGLESELISFKDNFQTEKPYTINIYQVTANSISFKLRYENDRNCFMVESRYILDSDNNILRYEILKWGTTIWS